MQPETLRVTERRAWELSAIGNTNILCESALFYRSPRLLGNAYVDALRHFQSSKVRSFVSMNLNKENRMRLF
jgi:hypothetical protein